MSSFGKWVGGGLGWVLGGPIGGVVGFVVGAMFDHSDIDIHAPGATQPGDFAIALVILSGAIMNADGKKLKNELTYIKDFFKHNYGVEKTRELMIVLRETIDKEYSLKEVCKQIKTNMVHPARLQLLHFLVGIAGADGTIDENEMRVLTQVADYLGISVQDFESVKSMYIKTQDSAYKILEVSPQATDEEIKKAYRKMAAKYHPDKVSHLGEEVINGALEKFQQLTEAFDTIKKQRVIK